MLFLGLGSVDVCKVDVPRGGYWTAKDGDLVLAGLVTPCCFPKALRPWCHCSLAARVAPEALHSLAGAWCHPGSPPWPQHFASTSRHLLGCCAAAASLGAQLEGLTFSAASARRSQG